MYKRLLLTLAIGLSAMASFAYQLNDYIYTSDAKYKVVGQNIIANGNFASNYSSWSTLTAAAVSPDFWSVETGAGPNGEKVFHDGMLMPGVTEDGQKNTNVMSQAYYYWNTYNWGGPQYSSSRYELYIQKNSDAMFSHGLCPDCAQRLYGDILRDK